MLITCFQVARVTCHSQTPKKARVENLMRNKKMPPARINELLKVTAFPLNAGSELSSAKRCVRSIWRSQSYYGKIKIGKYSNCN